MICINEVLYCLLILYLELLSYRQYLLQDLVLTAQEENGGLHSFSEEVNLASPEGISICGFKTLIFNLFFVGFIVYVLGMTGAQVIQMLGQNYRLPQPSNCPLQFYNIMLECWNGSFKDRPTFETLHWKFGGLFVTDSSYSDTNNFL